MKTTINSSKRTNHVWFRVSIAFLICFSFLIFPTCLQDELDQELMETEEMEFLALDLSPYADLYYGSNTFNSVFKQTNIFIPDISNPDFSYFENFALKVQNGNSYMTKVSMVEIRIDGVLILTSKDFGQKVNIVSKQISGLTATSQFEVKLEGLIGSFIVLLIEGDIIPEPVTDADGNTYQTVKLGSQVWMAENLAYLPLVSPSAMGSNFEPYYYVSGYEGTSVNEAKATDNYDTYGVLYNWPAALNACPSGWHLPSFAEWRILEDYLIANGYNYDGTTSGNKIAKALASTTLWSSSTIVGEVGNTDYPNKRNVTGFTALPGGSRYYTGGSPYIGIYGFWWSATENDVDESWFKSLGYTSTAFTHSGYYKELGFSVRCVKD